jgi:hypothetical protein
MPALLLATALVVSQFAGLLHRVEHPDVVNGNGAPFSWVTVALDDAHAVIVDGSPDRDTASVLDQPGSDHDSNDGLAHHCAAYDAATLGNGPPLGTAVAATFQGAQHAPCSRLTGLTEHAVAAGYFSRAPPRA